MDWMTENPLSISAALCFGNLSLAVANGFVEFCVLMKSLRVPRLYLRSNAISGLSRAMQLRYV